MPNEYDRLLKEIFSHLKITLVRMLFNIEPVAVRSLVSKFQQSILEKEADTVAEITTSTGEKFIIHIEWQTTNDRQMAERMLLYNNLLRLKYNKPVLGLVVYMGKEKLKMTNRIQAFGLKYHFIIKDVKSINPALFLTSDEPADWIFAILTGKAGNRTKLIRKILFKLHRDLKGEPEQLKIKLKQLEILSLLKGQNVQQQVIKEEKAMPVTIDITKDLRYQAGIEKGIKKGIAKGIEKGIEKGQTDKSTLFVRNLLQNTSFSTAKIAALASVTEDFVKTLKKAEK